MEHCSTDNNPVPTDDATPRERRSQRQDAVGEEISTGSNNGGKLNEQQRNNVTNTIHVCAYIMYSIIMYTCT